MSRCRLCTLILMLTVLVFSCASQPPPPKPTHLILEFETGKGINPDPDGRPSPLAFRIYELKSLSHFNGADFISLYGKDTNQLGTDLVRKHELILQPNDKKTLNIEASSETKALGVFAVFRNYEQAQWKASAGIRPHETTEIQIKANGNRVTIDYWLPKPTDKK